LDDYALVEEVNSGIHHPSIPFSGGKKSLGNMTVKYRLLDPDENIWKTQSRWNGAGRFLLEKRDQVSSKYFDKVLCVFELLP
jgi:hypothetical protein